MAITMKDSRVYETPSLSSFQRSVQRDQNNENSTVNIFQDPEFAKSREALLARKIQSLEKFAKGNRRQAERALTEAKKIYSLTMVCLETGLTRGGGGVSQVVDPGPKGKGGPFLIATKKNITCGILFVKR